ncbi:Rossmann-like and DUF2520 domain-containing protein [Anaerocellum danielii]|uniref:DUF2520 domain-containing protein n=1 Tax=Anaerocellum danielii TaxID=1387557 RepID=A0ABZ0TXF1_9FIRM|nr:Rossmann-like and DUF2520 domain-containing protein [Caldicellulosiruptor danielii]WPX08111.1 DUF2520 domain-containing protein [Caldicellulosiruptor danielii]
MKIGFYGASKAGISLAFYFKDHGLEITGFYNRTYEKAIKAASMTKTRVFENPEDLLEASDVIFIAISDTFIEEVSKNLYSLHLSQKVIGHLSGALTSDAIRTECRGKFSLHPIQTLRGQPEDVQFLKEAMFSLEGDEEGKKAAKIILQKIGNKYIELKKEDKVVYHLAATVASNYLIALLNFSYLLYKKIGLADEVIFSIIKPLSFASLENFLKDRLNCLTGPAARGDVLTLQKHYNALPNEKKPAFLELLMLAADLVLEKGDKNVYEKLQQFTNSVRW